jgi:hypothetical protein
LLLARSGRQLKRISVRWRQLEALTPDENLIAHVARATCFGYRLDPEEVPESDLRLYVNELISLFSRKPSAVLATSGQGEVPQSLAATVAFCAHELKDAAPTQAARLRALLKASADEHGAT